MQADHHNNDKRKKALRKNPEDAIKIIYLDAEMNTLVNILQVIALSKTKMLAKKSHAQ